MSNACNDGFCEVEPKLELHRLHEEGRSYLHGDNQQVRWMSIRIFTQTYL